MDALLYEGIYPWNECGIPCIDGHRNRLISPSADFQNHDTSDTYFHTKQKYKENKKDHPLHDPRVNAENV